MGLDNGITLQFTQDTPAELLALIRPYYDSYDCDDKTKTIDLLYWRKCWNIRELILTALDNDGYNTDYATGEYILDIDIFESILLSLQRAYNYEWWYEHNDSIWDWVDIEYDEDKPPFDHGIADVCWESLSTAFMVLGILRARPEYQKYCVISFYDSY